MRNKILSAAVVAVSASLVGGMAYAATQSVSTRPAPQVVIPPDDVPTTSTPTTVDDRAPARTSTTTATPRPTPTTLTTPTTTPTDDDRGRDLSGPGDGVTGPTSPPGWRPATRRDRRP